MFSIRMVCAESYQAFPLSPYDLTFSEFRNSRIKNVPTIRIFGSTLIGEKVCLHIHGVFPYIYIPFVGGEDAEILAHRLAEALDSAINISLGFATADTQHVYKIQQVKGVPFYGFHEKKYHFLKIYFYNPATIKRAANLLQNGCILSQSFQPHEAHIPFILQFMIDYNIYGMGLVNLKDVKYRQESHRGPHDQLHGDDLLLHSKAKEYLPPTIKKQSVCEIEVDAWAWDVQNREASEHDIDINPGLAAIWAEEKVRKILVGFKGGDSQSILSSSPRRMNLQPTDNDTLQMQRFLRQLLITSENCDSTSGNFDRSSYPVELHDEFNLLDASYLEKHIESSSFRDIKYSGKDAFSQNQNRTLDQCAFEADDIPLVDILENLAQEHKTDEQVDGDSILGSHCSVALNEYKSDEEDEDEVSDFSLTTIDINSLSLDSELTSVLLDKSRSTASDRENYKSPSPRKYRSPNDLNDKRGKGNQRLSPSSLPIPQFDGVDDLREKKSPGQRINISKERKKGDRDKLESDIIEKEKLRISDLCEDTLEIPQPEFDRIPPPQISGFVTVECKSALSATLESSNHSKKLKIDHSSMIEEKLICDYKMSDKRELLSYKKEVIVKHKDRSKTQKESIPNREKESAFQISDHLSLTPKKASNSSQRTVRSSSVGLENPSQAQRSPRKSIRSPRRNYSSLSITIAPSKTKKELNKQKLFRNVEDNKSSKNVQLKKTSVSTQDCTPIKIAEGISDVEMKKKIPISQDLILLKRSDDEVSQSNKFELSHRSRAVKVAEKLSSTQTSKDGRNREYAGSSRSRKRLLAITTQFRAPSRQNIVESFQNYGIPACKNVEPFYSNHNDIRAQKNTAYQIMNQKGMPSLPSFKSEIGDITGIKLCRRIKINEFQTSNVQLETVNIKRRLAEGRSIIITPLHVPAHRKEINKWKRAKKSLKHDKKKDIGNTNVFENRMKINHLSNPERSSLDTLINDSPLHSTLNSSELGEKNERQDKKIGGIIFEQLDFSISKTQTLSDVERKNLQNAKAITTYQYLTVICLEVHISTRKDLLPDPRYDPVEAVFYAIHNDVPYTSSVKRLQQGIIMVDINQSRTLQGLYPTCATTYATCEKDLFSNIVTLIRKCDPDILIGWELETLSWGYVLQRAAYLGVNLAMSLSRIPGMKCTWESKAVDLDVFAEIRLSGRIVLDLWRIMRHENALLSYTFENVMYHVMHQRLPHPSFETLTVWWNSKGHCQRWRAFEYYIKKILGIFKLLDHLDIIGRTCEHARLFGIQFFEVFSRGSQFRVESMMLRLAKPLNYILVSPSVRQRASMRAPEALPLIMEPISTFYSDPVIVLDFQSLYPSIIIAYNYCFSTCLGRIEHIGQQDPFEFGCTSLKVTKKTALELQGKINFSPIGVGFVKAEVRKGILPKMLTEILNTRLMVKKSMKDHSKDDRPLQQTLHNRQLGLKLIANVTYGYTSANFSGRMPCIEVGDSIVSKGKETLERAIKLVETTSKWEARVIYGDTDSLFILLSGKSRYDAFKIGAEIADAVTAANPPPVKLKFEKVLQPCILQTKKRYCGYSYETLESGKPEFLAKGIETVRRDGCPAAAKILEKSLKILFDTKDLSLVKQYVIRQLDKVFRGAASIQDLTFAKEFRGMRGYKKKACVPSLELTRRLIKRDPRAVPRTGERVRYVIVAGEPNKALIHSVKSPSELLADQNLRPNPVYYITRVIIPPLNRCLNLLGVDVNIWFKEMPHREVLRKAPFSISDRQRTTISQFFNAVVCISCESTSENKICEPCEEQPSRTIAALHQKLQSLEKNVFDVDVICRSCTGQLDVPGCSSLDCPVLYRRFQVEREYGLMSTLHTVINEWKA